MKRLIVIVWVASGALTLGLLRPPPASPHCDGLDGPVVTAARKALDTQDIAPVLIWVKQQNEGEVRTAFQETLTVRALSPDAQALADRYFFETVVRIHRAGEGAPFTGLKAAGRDLGPAIPAADKALREGSVEPLRKLLTEVVERGVREHFRAASARRAFDKNDIQAGRQYVEAYVAYVHYVERLYEAASRAAEGHYHEARESSPHAN